MEFQPTLGTFFMSPRTRNLHSRQISKTMSSNQLDFFINWVIYFLERIL